MKLMHVDASPKGDHSNSRALSRYFVEQLRGYAPALEVDYLDVAVDTPAHPTELFARATYAPPSERTPEMAAALAASDALCTRVLAADVLVFAMPMHNFTIPSAFKAFIDNLVRAGVTYEITDDHRYVGKLDKHELLFITSRGADLSPGSPMAHMDALTPALRASFGFMGATAPRFVDAQPLQFADKAAHEAAMARAKTELDAVAREWTSASSSAA